MCALKFLACCWACWTNGSWPLFQFLNTLLFFPQPQYWFQVQKSFGPSNSETRSPWGRQGTKYHPQTNNTYNKKHTIKTNKTKPQNKHSPQQNQNNPPKMNNPPKTNKNPTRRKHQKPHKKPTKKTNPKKPQRQQTLLLRHGFTLTLQMR